MKSSRGESQSPLRLWARRHGIYIIVRLCFGKDGEINLLFASIFMLGLLVGGLIEVNLFIY